MTMPIWRMLLISSDVQRGIDPDNWKKGKKRSLVSCTICGKREYELNLIFECGKAAEPVCHKCAGNPEITKIKRQTTNKMLWNLSYVLEEDDIFC
ncbi:hypothetical protein Indivirus_5_3 [Indivirus ILV1]|uniref:Uncharacterized protein n=1 Tax=Indivirus ILV1 TaxID=1977633 RepID=A0A1V0SDT1_9VIRU|nr:hypothetical protein Indivirus_5_3 [Indivirus ILV1]